MKQVWNEESFNKWLNENEPTYKLLEIYRKKEQTFIKVLCNNNHEYDCNIQHFIKRGYRCKKCYYLKYNMKKLNRKEIIEYFESKGFIIEDIKKISVDYMYTCKDKDGYILRTSVTNLKANKTPSKWHKSNPYSIQNISNYLKIFRSDYIIVSKEYIGYNESYNFKYIGKEFYIPEELKIFRANLGKFLGRRQENPHISSSKIEKIFELILIELNKNYKKEFTFEDLKIKAKLRYDFALKDKEDNLIKIYELHGSQHYEHYELFGTYAEFLERQKVDKIKEEYCIKNEIDFEIIKYDFFNKEQNILKLKRQLSVL